MKSCNELPIASALPELEAEGSSGSLSESGTLGSDAESTTWRNEVADRLSRYRARRKAPPPRYPSLKLPFGVVESSGRTATADTFNTISNQALALEPKSVDTSIIEESGSAVAEAVPLSVPPPLQVSAKIIEFPRFAWGPPAPPPDQLAEPVLDLPRILEVPETAPPPPALGGITIEPTQSSEVEKRPGIDTPLQAAPLGLRIFAFLIDGTIVGFASMLFSLIFWKVAVIQPPRLQMIGLAAGIPYLFWAAYDYLLIVYSGSTPGIRAAHLELTRFDGRAAPRSLRRWRVLASYLSAASLGMGYAWLFLDEDSLCWHDRITHTYLAPKGATPRS
jgi:RDD family